MTPSAARLVKAWIPCCRAFKRIIKTLFQRAISESGPRWHYGWIAPMNPTLKDAEKTGVQIADNLGLANAKDQIAAMRAKSSDEVLKAAGYNVAATYAGNDEAAQKDQRDDRDAAVGRVTRAVQDGPAELDGLQGARAPGRRDRVRPGLSGRSETPGQDRIHPGG